MTLKSPRKPIRNLTILEALSYVFCNRIAFGIALMALSVFFSNTVLVYFLNFPSQPISFRQRQAHDSEEVNNALQQLRSSNDGDNPIGYIGGNHNEDSRFCYIDCLKDFPSDFPDNASFSPNYLPVPLKPVLFQRICQKNTNANGDCFCKLSDSRFNKVLGEKQFVKHRDNYRKLCEGYRTDISTSN